ncbi:MAG TPA: LEA type 2 family protein [Gemmatimonadales bacterium]|nr:LEA type 2 family protein [Gemmatimonadales bacterium]
MASHSWGPVLSVLLLVACTPLGFWVYTDPVVTVSRVSLQLRRSIGSPVVVGLAVENRNDYALETERIEVALRLDGKPIGKLKRDSIMSVEMSGVSSVDVVLPLEKQVTSKQLVALNSGTHSFAVRGRATFRTPFGVRKVHFEQEGAMLFGERAANLRP